MSIIKCYKTAKVQGSFIAIRKFNPCNGYSALGWRRDHEKTKNYAKKFSRAKIKPPNEDFEVVGCQRFDLVCR
jgi:hypothetical protein